MQFGQDFTGAGAAGSGDFATRIGGGEAASTDLGTSLGGLFNSFVGGTAGGATTSPVLGGGGMSGNDFAVATGALAASAGGAALGIPPEIAGKIGAAIGGLFGGKKTDEAAQSADINKIAAINGVTPGEAAAVIANHADHSSDHFNDLAASVATFDAARFPSLLAEYNQAHSDAPIVLGSVNKAAEAKAASQQQLITTALQTNGFASTATGQQLVGSLQLMDSNAVVGTQGQTAGDILNQILKGIGNGAVKGGTDAAAETDLGKSMKQNYLVDWAKENQLLAAGIGAFGAFGLVELYKKLFGKGGKVSI